MQALQMCKVYVFSPYSPPICLIAEELMYFWAQSVWSYRWKVGGLSQRDTQSLNVNIRRFRQLTRDTPLQGLGVGLYMLHSVTE